MLVEQIFVLTWPLVAGLATSLGVGVAIAMFSGIGAATLLAWRAMSMLKSRQSGSAGLGSRPRLA